MTKVSKVSSILDVKALLKKALEDKIFDAVLGLFWMPSNDMLTLELTSEVDEIDKLEVIAPIMPVQAARAISNIKFTESNLKIACIVKPCELRASVELIKLKQIMPENLIFISYDCGGAINVADFKDAINNGKNNVDVILDCNKNFEDFSAKYDKIRFACSVCDKFIPSLCDIRIRSFGSNILLQPMTQKGESLLLAMKLEAEDANLSEYDNRVSSILNARREKRNKEREIFKSQINSIDAVLKELSSCIRCHNCMTNCPLDYCKECIFKTPVFDHPVENYELWLNRKGMVKLPTDTLLFHLTRLNHMSSSCVSCGACESACPVGIRVSRMFMFLGEDVQKIFDYEPGRSLQEELPVATFREKELEKI